MDTLQKALAPYSILLNPLYSYALVKAAPRGMLRRYDAGWFVVLIAVLLALGATIFVGMVVWCVTSGHGTFTGNWSYHDLFSLSVNCSW